ncbi:MAG: hypothetical protein ABI651_05015, partial [Verrucomicrobiota bacterium]
MPRSSIIINTRTGNLRSGSAARYRGELPNDLLSTPNRSFCFARRAIQKNLSGTCALLAVLHCLQCFGVALGQPLTPPRLSIQPLANRSVRVAWPNSAAGFVLEESSGPSSTLWQAVGRTPIEQDNQFAVTVDASAGNRFFRLRLPLFTTIEETSPVNGETGVAVIRETIVRFT